MTQPKPHISFRLFCEHDSSERRAKFIVDCAEAANPKSDEEGEDLVRQCEITSKDLFCDSIPHACVKWDCVPCELTQDEMNKIACDSYVR